MKGQDPRDMFGLQGKVIAATGGGGVLVGRLCEGLARAGARVAVLDIDKEAAEKKAEVIGAAGGVAMAVEVDVLDKGSLERAAERIEKGLGPVECLVNGAGGNHPKATTSPETPFFDLPAEAVEKVFALNFLGTLFPSQVFGRAMAERKEGVILNVSSMSAFRPLTRVSAYSAAKAAVSNFTQWLAVHMAREYSPSIRVNALAPGFFATSQNRFLLYDEKTGELTPRGKTILDHTPMARFGDPRDLLGAALWLLSPASAFVTGVVVPVDGGFSAFGGV